ncbi:MAG: hypothetical protein JRJ85_22335, partial [Deltaproteobacteria bacterium]|nr:hypothetical protein [Deltaproteobacteria bacterium]
MVRKHQYIKEFHFLRFSNQPFIKHIAILVLTIFVLLPSCVEKKMTLKEAKQVTVSMAGESFVPPPRRVDDILAVLDQKGQFDPEDFARMKAEADISPPDTEDRAKLTRFYFERGFKARDLSRYKQYLEDLRKALDYYGEASGHGKKTLSDRDYARLLVTLAVAEANLGHFGRGIALIRQSIDVKAWNPAVKYRNLAICYFLGGDLKAGEEITAAGLRICNQNLRNPSLSGVRENIFKQEKALLQSELLGAKGQFTEAEPHRRTALKIMDKLFKGINRRQYFFYRCSLAMNLAHQGRLLEAELEIRDVLREVIGLTGKGSGETALTLLRFGEILLIQGRIEDAKKLMHVGIRNLEASGFPRDSYWYGELRRVRGEVSVAKGDFIEALMQFNLIKEDMRDNPYGLNLWKQNPNIILSLIKAGNVKEAMRYINENYRNYNEYLGEKHYRTAEMLGLRGMANALTGEDEKGMKDFAVSIPLLLKERPDGSDPLKNQRLKVIVEAYLDLLSRVRKSGQEKRLQINPSAEIFKLCEKFNGSIVRSAMGASGARAAAGNPELADLVRREQDTSKQIDTFKRTLSNALAAPPDQQNPGALADLKATIDSLTRARIAILDEIKSGFPKYADFMNPQSPDFSTIKEDLNAGEAMIVIYPAGDKTYVWGIPKVGKVDFAVLPLGSNDLRDKIVRLRNTLAPTPGTFGDIPKYDLSLAYEIYAKLFKPVEAGWKDTKDLIIVAPGPMGQIPFSVLLTRDYKMLEEKDLLFASYRDVPWLIRKCSVTRLPSVSSLITLRALPEGDPNRKAFMGFGYPYFNPDLP